MNADEANKFQLVLKRWREARAALWEAVKTMQLFTSELHATETLMSELADAGAVIPRDARQEVQSPFAEDVSYNYLLNEHAIFDALLATETAGGELTAFRKAIGADVAY